MVWLTLLLICNEAGYCITLAHASDHVTWSPLAQMLPQLISPQTLLPLETSH